MIAQEFVILAFVPEMSETYSPLMNIIAYDNQDGHQ